MLKAKLSVLKKAMGVYPSLEPLKQRAATLANDFSRLAHERNKVSHGAATVWRGHHGYTTIFEAGGSKYAMKHEAFDVSDIARIGALIQKLGEDAEAFGRDFLYFLERG